MKKKIYLTVVSLLIAVSAFGQNVKISGEVDSGIKSVTLNAFNSKTLSYEEIVKVDVKASSYRLKLKSKNGNLYKLDFGGKKTARLSITDEKSIKVDYKNEMLDIEGSPESVAMLSFEQENGEMQGKFFGQLKKDADVAMASGDKKAMAKIQERSGKAIQAFLPELRKWIISKGEGPAGYYAIGFSDFNKELAFIETRLEAFKANSPNSEVTKALDRQVYRAKVVSVGKTPPAIVAIDRDGKEFGLEQYQGKILLIDFWAAWCRACRIENPQFVKLHEEYNAQGFEVVSVSQDATKKAWEAAIEKDGVDIWRHIWDKKEVITDLYSVGSLPQNVVLGRDGKIIGKNVNAETLKALLDKSL
jgi:peroxiredoxin